MPRVARVMIAEVAHHVTQRGNGRQFILATDSERLVYLDLLRQALRGADENRNIGDCPGPVRFPSKNVCRRRYWVYNRASFNPMASQTPALTPLPPFAEIKDGLRRLYLEDPRPWLVGFSGGKDSTMLAAVIFDVILSVPARQRKKPVAATSVSKRA